MCFLEFLFGPNIYILYLSILIVCLTDSCQGGLHNSTVDVIKLKPNTTSEYKNWNSKGKIQTCKCQGLFRNDEFFGYLNSCLESGASDESESAEREEYIPKYSSDDTDNKVSSYPNVDLMKPLRHKRHASPRKWKQSGYWKIFSSRDLRRNPCVATCALRKYGMVNDTDYPDFDGILTRVEEIFKFANKTDYKQLSSQVVSMCIEHHKDDIATSGKEELTADSTTLSKCWSVVDLGLCLTRTVLAACRQQDHGEQEEILMKME